MSVGYGGDVDALTCSNWSEPLQTRVARTGSRMLAERGQTAAGCGGAYLSKGERGRDVSQRVRDQEIAVLARENGRKIIWSHVVE